MRKFDSGATRSDDFGRLDYEGFLSPLVLQRYAEYLNKHRVQADGGLRASDNWQKGIPIVVYMKSMWRHFMELWAGHRSGVSNENKQEALCALLFNVMGYLHELLNNTDMVKAEMKSDVSGLQKMKLCSGCHQHLLRSAFGKNRSKPGGLQAQCKECCKDYKHK